jgi:hypothetical protein
MRFAATAALLIAIAIAVPAKADRPVVDPERVKLQEAVTAQGCSGGKVRWNGMKTTASLRSTT